MLISSHVKAAGEDPPPPRIIRLDGGSSANRRPSGSLGYTRRATRKGFRFHLGPSRFPRRLDLAGTAQRRSPTLYSCQSCSFLRTGRAYAQDTVVLGASKHNRKEHQGKRRLPAPFSLLRQPLLTTIPASRTCPASCRRTGRRTAPARGASPSQACRCRPGGRRRNGSG